MWGSFTTMVGFEPTRSESIRLAGAPGNHFGTLSPTHIETFSLSLFKVEDLFARQNVMQVKTLLVRLFGLNKII